MRILSVIPLGHTMPRNYLTAESSYKNNIILFSHEYVGIYFLKFDEVRQKEFASVIPFSKQSYKVWK